MKVKEIECTANVAWSPAAQHPIYLAAGTAAQQLDATFSTSASLDIFGLDLAECGMEMSKVGSVQSECRFHKLVWGSFGMSADNAAGTLVAGGDNGRVFIYDPNQMMSGGECLLHTLDKHVGAVSALDVNPFQDNLLASGASESEIYIWDLNNPVNPMTPGSKSQPPDDVTCIAWNQQVQHILASTYAGRCIVWDLRKNEPIIKVSDSMSRIKSKLVCWHPDVATQMCLASEDDHSPVIQLWDLRFATSPLKSLESHQRGILSMAWCPHDPDLLLSCGKDNRILCWNPNTAAQNGEVVYELPTANQWSFDVQWCPRNPAVISSCSFDGHISVYSLMGGAAPPKTPSKVADAFPDDPFAQPHHQPLAPTEPAPTMLKRPPKWLRRPVGASFGFGGKLISFENVKQTSPQQAPVQRQLHISQVVTESDLVSRSNQLENALTKGQYAEFCALKISNSTSDAEESVWSFLKVNFESDPRTRFLELLGYNRNELSRKVQSLTTDAPVESNGVDAVQLAEKMASLKTDKSGFLRPPLSGSGPISPRIDRSKTPDSDLASEAGGDVFEKIAAHEKEVERDDEPLPIAVDDDCDGLVAQALLTANFEAAVEVCLHNDRMAEAIILALAGGPELLAQTQKTFFQRNKGNLNRLISSVVTRDYEHIIRTCELENWKEALAVVLTYAKGEDFSTLCTVLGDRLSSAGDEYTNSACLCYICAGSIDRLVECWAKTTNNPNSPDALSDVVEKVMILRKAVEVVRGPNADDVSSVLAQRLSQYAELLASQGCLDTAMNYLGTSNEMSLAILRDRLYQALGQAASHLQQPPVPFETVKVNAKGVAPTVAAARPQQPQQQQQQQRPGAPFQAQAGSTFQTTTTPSSTYYAPASQQSFPGNMAATSTYSQPSMFTPQAPQYPTSSQPAAVSQPQIYDPSAMRSQMTPGAPSAGMPAHNNQPTSMPNTLPKGNHPCFHSNPSSLSQKPTQSYMTPTPITQPIYGVPQPNMAQPPVGQLGQVAPQQPPADQGPPGAPSYSSANIYNPQEFQQPAPQKQYAHKPEPPKPVEKGPIPAEHQVLKDILDNLVQQCLTKAANAQTKRKLDDVLRKLESLYDKLRGNSLSPTVTSGLHQIIGAIQKFDYHSGLSIHTQMISQGNFSEISSFMPGIKMLIQTAITLQVYVQ
ncbi:hypothetical protein CAPTEDRAFT_20326 [Capitella teleta]|uniref:Protein transport protein Sec31A n=1 Tax=Capitella teleta TaxID=283909 RepID=R7UQF4_CAPTE|nr:hypothetical protein CAPTEDRAFT_20326 [Capitella teleta]|eukprot:ELU08343.1 hypothetical protein CAPTEDRAFT_20326 [Capitella teleta]